MVIKISQTQSIVVSDNPSLNSLKPRNDALRNYKDRNTFRASRHCIIMHKMSISKEKYLFFNHLLFLL